MSSSMSSSPPGLPFLFSPAAGPLAETVLDERKGLFEVLETCLTSSVAAVGEVGATTLDAAATFC